MAWRDLTTQQRRNYESLGHDIDECRRVIYNAQQESDSPGLQIIADRPIAINRIGELRRRIDRNVRLLRRAEAERERMRRELGID